MFIVYNAGFLKASRISPKNIQNKLATALEILQQNPFHPLLHTKQLSGRLAGFLSFRITRDWRVVFYFKNPETISLTKIAHRKDIYR